METKIPQQDHPHPQPHSDPTYEAWKQEDSVEMGKGWINSDPTYEAWKRGVVEMMAPTPALFRSYL